MNPQDLQNLLDTLKQFSDKLGTIADDIKTNANNTQAQVNQNNTKISRSWSELGEATKKLSKRLDENEKSAQKNEDSQKRTYKQQDDAVKFFSRGIRQSTTEFSKNLQTGKISLNEFRDQINSAKDDIKNEQNLKVQQKQELMREIEALDKNVQRQAKYGFATDLAGKALGQLGKAAGVVGGATLDVVRSYQNSSSQIGISTAAMSAGVNLAGTGLSMVGDSASIAGGMLTAFSRGPWTKGLGVALQVAGFGASFAGKSITELGKVVLPILNTEMEKQIQSFQALSNIGAIFANGVDGMRKASIEAGMDLGMLSNVFKTNTEQFANSGLGMTAVMERFAGARSRSIADGFQKQLLNLGYSVEQQGGLMAQVFQQLGRSGKAQTATSEEIAKQTLEYGKTLKVITELTGADAAKRMQEAGRQMQEVQIASKIREMEAKNPGAEKRIQAILATVPDELKLGVKQKLVLGQVVDQTTNEMISQSPKMGQAMDTIVGAMYDSSLDAKSGAALTVKTLSAARDQLAKDLEAMGTAQLADPMSFTAPAVEKANKIIAQTQSFADKLTADGAPKRTEDAAKTENKATAAMNNVIENNIKMAMKIQELILDTDIMGKYAKAMTNLTDTVIEQISKFGGKSKPENENDKSEAAKIGGATVAYGVPAATSIAGAVAGEAIGKEVIKQIVKRGITATTTVAGGVAGTGAMPGPGSIAGAIAGGILGEKLGEAIVDSDVGEILITAGEKVGQIVEASVEIAKAGFNSIIGMFKNAPHAKQGGIINSDVSGSIAMLHGTEAVLPLDDASIMTKLRNSLMPEAGNANQLSGVSEILKNMQDNNSNILKQVYKESGTESYIMMRSLLQMQPSTGHITNDLITDAITKLNDQGSISIETNNQIKQLNDTTKITARDQLISDLRNNKEDPLRFTADSPYFAKYNEAISGKQKQPENFNTEDIFGDRITKINTQLQGGFLNINDTISKIPKTVTNQRENVFDSEIGPAKEKTGIVSDLFKTISSLIPNMGTMGTANDAVIGALNNLTSLSDASNKSIDNVSQALTGVKDSMQAIVQQKQSPVSEEMIQAVTGKVMDSMGKTLDTHNEILTKISGQMADLVDHSRATNYNTEQMKYSIQ